MEPYVFYHPGGLLAPEHTPTNCRYHFDAGWYYVEQRYYSNELDVYGPNARGGYASKRRAEVGRELHVRRMEWRKIWGAAFNNMPARIRKVEEWQIAENQQPTIPDYIRGLVKGNYKMWNNGEGLQLLHERSFKEYEYGRQNLLHLLVVGYIKNSLSHNYTANMMQNGHRPSDPGRRERLLQLAAPDGRQVAIRMIKERGLSKRYKLED